MSGPLDQARTQVLEWLRANHREPSFLVEETDAALALRHVEITQRFLHWAQHAGFAYEIIPAQLEGRPASVVHWTHRGASFVGFKQPPPEEKVEDALLVGCAALLENQWCRHWLQ